MLDDPRFKFFWFGAVIATVSFAATMGYITAQESAASRVVHREAIEQGNKLVEVAKRVEAHVTKWEETMISVSKNTNAAFQVLNKNMTAMRDDISILPEVSARRKSNNVNDSITRLDNKLSEQERVLREVVEAVNKLVGKSQ